MDTRAAYERRMSRKKTSPTQELEHILTVNPFLTGFLILTAFGFSAAPAEAAKGKAATNTVGHAKIAKAAKLPHAVVVAEKYHPTANLSYKVAGKRYYPTKNVANFTETGRASWYGPGFHGKKTSNGERFDMNMMTAAHPTLPIPSYVRVTNLSNGKSVVVRVNDRGPFHGNRAIDLSKAAAAKLDFVHKGTAQVRIDILKAGDSMADGQTTPVLKTVEGKTDSAAKRIFVSLKKFDSETEAQAFMRATAKHLRKANAEQRAIMVKQSTGYVVRVGPFAEQKHADDAHNLLKQDALAKQDVI